MKRFFMFVTAVILIFSLTACGGSSEKKKSDEGTSEVAMIVDGEQLAEGSVDQNTWLSVKALADENGLSSQYYNTKDPSKDTYLASIQKAVDKGAKFIVLPGSNFETAAYAAQSAYPDVDFLLIGLCGGKGRIYEAGIFRRTGDTFCQALWLWIRAGSRGSCG